MLRRLACRRSHKSAFAVDCADCGADMSPRSREGMLVWLLGGAVLGCLTMALLQTS